MERYGRAFGELALGETFTEALTITEAHLSLAAGLFNDYNTLHTDEPKMQRSRFGKRISHGALTFGLMVGVYSKVFQDTDISTVEASIKFTAPIYIGDTIEMTWRVSALEPKTRLDGGLVELEGEVQTQDGRTAATLLSKLLVGNKPLFAG